MPSWRKSPQALVDTFAAALPADSRVERHPMFGYPCAFVGGHMACGLHQEDVVLRLDDDAAKALGGAPFEPMAGRPMRGFFTAPSDVVADRTALSRWLKRAIEHALTLPPKAKAPPAAKRAATLKRAAQPQRAAKPSPRAPAKEKPTPAKTGAPMKKQPKR